MRIALLLFHAIEEYDQVSLLTELGYDVFNFRDSTQPFGDMRPGVPSALVHQDLIDACNAKRAEHAGQHDVMTPYGPRWVPDWAKGDIPQEVIDWADVIVCHHFEHTVLVPQWHRLRDKRVIWRTVGQSLEGNERMMAPLHGEGLQIVRYSPKERWIPGFAGEDALIRFWKDPDEWGGWTGERRVVLNIAQHDSTPHRRDGSLNWRVWEEYTKGLPKVFAGSHSEKIGGLGTLPLDAMKDLLRRCRCYLYTGTQPASYTMGLIEAMMTGIPVVSIGPEWMQHPLLFEGHQLAEKGGHHKLRRYLNDAALAQGASILTRQRAIELFGKQKIAAEWREFLGAP